MSKQKVFFGLAWMLLMVTSSAWAQVETAAQAGPEQIDPVMDNRLSLSVRTGFGGSERVNTGNLHIALDAAPSIGATLRFEIPVHNAITLGASTAYYASKIKNVAITNSYQSYDHNLELGAILKIRHCFAWTGAQSKRAMEIYLLVPAGTTLLFPANLGTIFSDDFAPGWHVGLLPGVQVHIRNRIGVLAEVGWMHRWSNFSEPGPNFKIALDQAVVHVGAVFYL